MAVPTEPPFVMTASRTLAWDPIASGVIGQSGSSNSGQILATDVRGDTVAMLARPAPVLCNAALMRCHHIVRILRGQEPPVDVDIAMTEGDGPFYHGTSAAIALDRDILRIAIAVSGGLQTATVRLADAQVTELRKVRRTLCDVDAVARGRGGWIAASRCLQGAVGPVAWFVADSATVFPAPFPVAATAAIARESAPQVATAPDGSAIVAVEVRLTSEPTVRVAAIRHGTTWTRLGAPFPIHGSVQLQHAGTGWMIAHGPTGAESFHSIDPVTGATRLLDAPWIRDGRWGMSILEIGGDVLVCGGRRTAQVGDRSVALSGAIYSAATGQMRPFPDPPADAIDPKRWNPGITLVLGDQLCFAGGTLSDTRPFRGAACFDHTGATWQWIAAPALPPACTDDMAGEQGPERPGAWITIGTLGTAPGADGNPDPAASFLLCTKKLVGTGRFAGEHWYGALQWSLWRVAIQPSQSSP